MKKIYGKVLYTVSILGMLLMLTISVGMLVSSTPKSLQNQGVSPITLYATAENNALRWGITWGATSSDGGRGMAIDTNGSLYCVGWTESFGAGGSDFALVKFAPTGTYLWNITWGGAGADIGYAVVVDASGFIYCAGSTNSFGAGSKDLALVKFAPNGVKLWNITWGGAGGESGNNVAVDAAGNLYCTGETTSFGAGSYDIPLIKFDSNGTKLWNTTWGGAGSDKGRNIVSDAYGSLYCVGETYNLGSSDNGFALVKFDQNGTKLWNTTWGNAVAANGMDLVLDASGSIYCVGDIKRFGASSDDIALVKFDQNSTRLWNTTWGGASDESGYGMAIDAGGSIYCVGWTESFGAGDLDFALVKFGYPSEEPGVPGFELVYLIIGLLALIPLVQRRRFYRTLS